MSGAGKTKKKRTYFIIAGEPSGDLHGAKLVAAMKKRSPNLHFVGNGGNKMLEEGVDLLYHTDQLSVMGFSEVVKHTPFLLKVFRNTLKKIAEIKPDRIILIDYPGFNLRMAKKCARLSIPITYFILPQLWAWKENRIKTFHKFIDQSLSIFPFEQGWYEKRGVSANYVGHPFTELAPPKQTKSEFYRKHKLKESTKILTLLPGSRQQEIDKMWPVFYEAACEIKKNNNIEIMVAKSSGVNLTHKEYCHIEEEDVYASILYATAAITASGTAALECAVLDTPQVVCYKLSSFSAFIAKQMNRAQFVSMPNLIAERLVVNELLQKEVNVDNISRHLLPLLKDSPQRKLMLQDFEEIRRSLGLPGVYERAAESILKRTQRG